MIGGCASYHAAVDHHLGGLAASLGNLEKAGKHFQAALAMHEALGAAGWARLSATALADVQGRSARSTPNEFRFVGDLWHVSFGGKSVRLQDSKGLRDLAVLIRAQGRDVHVFTLVGKHSPNTGSDPMLDDRAKAEYRARLTALAAELDEAEDWHDPDRAENLRNERDALIQQIAAVTGLGGRPRRLGDETERARKTVSARVRDALSKMDRAHPELAAHLREALQMGTMCSYAPAERSTWDLT